MYDFVPPTTLGSRGNPFPPNKNSTTARKFYGWFTWKSAGKGDEPNLDFPSFSASMFTKNPDPSRSIRIDGRNIPSLEYDCRGSPKKDIPGSLGVKLWGVYSIPSLPNTLWVGVWVSPAKAFRGSKHLLTETNSSHLKMDDWNTSFLLGWPIFRCYVSFRDQVFGGFWKTRVTTYTMFDEFLYTAERRRETTCLGRAKFPCGIPQRPQQPWSVKGLDRYFFTFLADVCIGMYTCRMCICLYLYICIYIYLHTYHTYKCIDV